MIRFIGGKPGGGKTLYAVNCLVEELRSTDRYIITNMALEMGPWVDGGGRARKGLVRSLQDKYGDDFDCERRIVLLEDEQVKRFYAVRPTEVDGVRHCGVLPQHEDKRFRLQVDGSSRTASGCCYFIDEAHEFWPAREWQLNGKEVLSWASQQRRAGDDAFFITQVIGNVEKQLRGVSQECVHMVNHRLQSLAMFRQPDVLSYRIYSTTPPAPSEQWLTAGRVTCDRQWIYGVYNTAKGVGVAGRGADVNQRAKGLHWTWIIWIVLGLGAFLYFGTQGLQSVIAKVVGIQPNYAKNTNEVAAVAPVNVTNTIREIIVREIMSNLPPAVVAAPKVVEDFKPWVVSEVLEKQPGGHYRGTFLLSDGTMVDALYVVRVQNGFAADGRFFSTVPTGGTNRMFGRLGKK